MRSGFSFVEVLISVAILAFLGTALIKFNAFNKRAMEKNIVMQENILLSSALLFESEIENNKEIDLFTLIPFINLDDDDMKFLKSVKFQATKETEDKFFLGNTGEEDLYMEYGNLEIKYKEYKQSYLWVQKEK